MNGYKNNLASIKHAIQCEHRELAQSIRAIDRQFVRLPSEANWAETADEMEQRLLGLRTCLEHHFHQELHFLNKRL